MVYFICNCVIFRLFDKAKITSLSLSFDFLLVKLTFEHCQFQILFDPKRLYAELYNSFLSLAIWLYCSYASHKPNLFYASNMHRLLQMSCCEREKLLLLISARKSAKSSKKYQERLKVRGKWPISSVILFGWFGKDLLYYLICLSSWDICKMDRDLELPKLFGKTYRMF